MDYQSFLSAGNLPFGEVGGVLFVILIIWSLIWKGLALWKAARREDTAWYVAMLILNTVGVLEIIYYFVVSKKEKKADSKSA